MKVNMPVTERERTYGENDRIISTTDPKGIITAINQTFIDICGFTKEELIQKNHNIIRHPDMPPAAFADAWTSIKEGNSWMGIVKNRCKNGDYYWVDAFISPVTVEGKIAEYQSVRKKPTEVRVKRAEAVYKRIFAEKKPFSTGLNFPARLFLCFILSLVPVVSAAYLASQLIAVAAAASVVLGWGLISWQLRPLRLAVAESKQVVDNPLMKYIYTGRTDEFGQLLLSQHMIASQLTAVVSRLDFSTDDLTEAADKTSDVAQQSSDSVQVQQHAVQEIASAINEMSASIEQVAQHAKDTSVAAEDADAKAHAGKQKLQATADSIETLSKDITSAAEVINRLGKESQEISSVLDVIREIAEQTNMLALNAAIEAARAGEQGRGFAVVADEVRTLAVRTQDSIEEIEKMIGRVQTSAKLATEAMEQSCNEAQQGGAHARDISEFLDIITESVMTINSMIAQIAHATEEQIQASNDIHRSAVDLNAQSDSSVAVASESGSVSLRLNGLTGQLKKLVKQFN